ncbi:MAG TPA: hypothetical protein VF683_00435, partial [Chthoniobacterales bacterium]
LNTPKLIISLINGYTPNLGDKFYIAELTGLLPTTTGVFGNAAGGTVIIDTSGNNYLINYFDTFGSTPGNDISLEFFGMTPVPEPSTWAAAALAALTLLVSSRRLKGRFAREHRARRS